MKIKTINIINGKILGEDSISFNTKAEYEDYINAMIDFVADRSLFTTSKFKSLVMDNCIAWKEAGVITLNILEETPINIGSSIKTRNNC